jgi:hypothetical protein
MVQKYGRANRKKIKSTNWVIVSTNEGIVSMREINNDETNLKSHTSIFNSRIFTVFTHNCPLNFHFGGC